MSFDELYDKWNQEGYKDTVTVLTYAWLLTQIYKSDLDDIQQCNYWKMKNEINNILEAIL